MTPAGAQSAVDLFAWPEVASARAAAEAAEVNRSMAERRLRHAPHGEISSRREAFQAATEDALRAEAALAAAIERASR